MNSLFNENNTDSDIDTDNDTETTVSTDTDLSDDDDYSYDYNSNFQLNLSNNYINKNVLLIPEIYNKYFHGRTFDSDPNIDGQFLVLQTFYINSDSNMYDFFKYVNNLSNFYKKYYEKNFCSLDLPHTLLRNYNNIIKQPSYLNIQIGKINYLKGSECVCVIKTFWLKIVQRSWKKIFKIRNNILKTRCRPDSIIYRQFTGKWPEKCAYMPSIRGMLM
jgi:hypothetical protein